MRNKYTVLSKKGYYMVYKMKIKDQKILIHESEKSSHEWLLLCQLINNADYSLECIKRYKITRQEKYIINKGELNV
jgi:hypothetical protein